MGFCRGFSEWFDDDSWLGPAANRPPETRAEPLESLVEESEHGGEVVGRQNRSFFPPAMARETKLQICLSRERSSVFVSVKVGIFIFDLK